MLSVAVATAAPVEETPLPVAPSEAWAAVRTALLAAEADDEAAADAPAAPAPSTVGLPAITVGLRAMTVGLALGTPERLAAESAVDDSGWLRAGEIAAGPVTAAGALTAPAAIWVDCEPLGWAPEVLTQICLSMSGRCQYCGATSITT